MVLVGYVLYRNAKTLCLVLLWAWLIFFNSGKEQQRRSGLLPSLCSWIHCTLRQHPEKKKKVTLNNILLTHIFLVTTLLQNIQWQCDNVFAYHYKGLITCSSMLQWPIHFPILKHTNSHWESHNTKNTFRESRYWFCTLTKFIEMSIYINKGNGMEVDFVGLWLWKFTYGNIHY